MPSGLWQPPKAWALPISLFLDGSCFGTPSKGTSLGYRESATRHLRRTYGELLRHDLEPWWVLPWQYGAKKLGVGWRQLILFMLVVWEPKTNQKTMKISFPLQKCYSHMQICTLCEYYFCMVYEYWVCYYAPSNILLNT
jgi:hypothetical protein